MAKKPIVKSISLEPTDEIAAFIKKQKNFSRTVRVLILRAIYQNGGKITDIAEDYERAMQAQIFAQMDNIAADMRPPEREKAVTEETPVKQSKNDTHIPEGY